MDGIDQEPSSYFRNLLLDNSKYIGFFIVLVEWLLPQPLQPSLLVEQIISIVNYDIYPAISSKNARLRRDPGETRGISQQKNTRR